MSKECTCKWCGESLEEFRTMRESLCTCGHVNEDHEEEFPHPCIRCKCKRVDLVQDQLLLAAMTRRRPHGRTRSDSTEAETLTTSG